MRRPDRTPPRGYENARMAWLNMPRPPESETPAYLGDAEAYMVGMEFADVSSGDVKRSIVLAGSAGDSSLYFENDNAQGVGGYVGGVTHSHIAKDAIAMVTLASRKISLMQPTADFPYVSPHHVRFIVATRHGRYTAEVAKQDIIRKTHLLSDLFWAGEQIITDYRLLTQQ
jgi:hypothetical protein